MNRARCVYLGVAFALGAVSLARAQSPDWTAFLTVRPDPSPYIADWQSDPSVVTLVLSYSGSADVPFYLDGTILRGGALIVTGRSTAFEFVRPSQVLLTTRDGIWEQNSVTYPSSLKDQLVQTGRIPDGDYQFCVDARQGTPETGGGALLAHACQDFTITAPQPPALVAPGNGDTVPLPLPLFTWSPVITSGNVSLSYHVRVAEVLPGQSPLEAINNLPQFEGDFTTTSILYPVDALSLRDSARYVWQVQAVDAVGQPVGERQGKSEVWAFTYQPIGRASLIALDSTRDTTTGSAERVVAQFQWGPVQVKVLSLTDSSWANYSGEGRVKIVPGLLEPRFRFKSVHLDSTGTRVQFAPRHVVSLPLGAGAADYALKNLPLPFWVNVTTLVLVADSATGDRHAGISGSGVIFLGLGTADSLARRQPDTSTVKWNCSPDTAKTRVDHSVTVCTSAKKDTSGGTGPGLWETYKALEARSLFFTFDDLRFDGAAPAGTITLGQDYTTGIFGLPDAQLKLVADSTNLVMTSGAATLTLSGEFKLPASAGLARDHPDTTKYQNSAGKDSAVTLDTAVTLKFSKAKLGTNGEFYLATAGLPLSHIGRTGLHIQTGNAWIDFSSALSPPGKPAGWQGVYFDSARVDLPDHWRQTGKPDSTASIVGYKLAIDGQGFSGDVYGTRLDRLGPVRFGGFEGKLDSLHFLFAAGTLDTGYVQGSVKMPFLDGDLAYWVNFTPVGVDQAYARLTSQQAISMPALHAKVVIQRGQFVYERPVGTFTMDARLTIDEDGVALKDAQVYGLSISNDGGIKLKGGWLGFDGGNQAGFKHFPVALDSIGFGSGTNGNEVWLGLAGRFALNDNLPAAAGAFRLFGTRSAPGADWGFEKVVVDKLDLSYKNAAVTFQGSLDYLQDDPIYGDGFKAALKLAVINEFSVDGNVLIGATNATPTASSFRYWYVDAKVLLPPPGIQLGILPLAIFGFGGGAYSHMQAKIDTLTLKATYIPDSTNLFGLKALITIGSSGNGGYAWNADATLEAAVGTSGGLTSLTLRGDNWMLTDVQHREKKIWGTVLVNLPVSQPVLHANMNLNVDLRPAMRGAGWAELHFAPDQWYIHVGTPARPDSLILLPATLAIRNTAYFDMDQTGVDAGFATYLQQEKTVGIFYGKVDAGYSATAKMRYRPFLAMGDGELWGDIIAKVKGYTLLEGTARASLAFRLPDPTQIWGKVQLKYSFLSGLLKGTYRMSYSWGSGGSDSSNTSAPFVIVDATYPVNGDTAATLSGVSYYLGMSEGVQYGTDDGVYRLRLSATPTIARGLGVPVTTRDPRTGKLTTTTTLRWTSIGSVVQDYDDARSTLTLKAPGYALLDPGATYQASASFVLEKLSGSAWTAVTTVTSRVQFRTAGTPVTLAQLVAATDPPGGASPLYYSGPNRGAVRVQFSNLTSDITSGGVRGQVVGEAGDSVAGTWASSHYVRAILLAGHTPPPDPTLYSFTPTAGALAPSTRYRFGLVRTDTTHREEYAVTFITSRYASLADHIHASTTTVTPDRGPGPTSGAGNYLRGATIALAGPEAMSWNDIDSIEVTGVSSGWQVTPSTRCQWIGLAAPRIAGLGITVRDLCGATPTYENVLAVSFTAASDASLPSASTGTITLRMNHRREGWQTFTFTVPPPVPPTVARTPIPPPPPTAPPVTKVDVTGVRRP
jgi:hypothetical protein